LVRGVPSNYPFAFRNSSKDILGPQYAYRSHLHGFGIVIKTGDATRQRNNIGDYYYVVADGQIGDVRCFIAGQALRGFAVPGDGVSVGRGKGQISLFHCSPRESTGKQALVDDMTAVMGSMRLR